jgi:hypothetical protein
VFPKLRALSLWPWGPVISGTPQPSGVTLHKEPLVPGSLKEFYLGSFHANYIIFGNVEILEIIDFLKENN